MNDMMTTATRNTFARLAALLLVGLIMVGSAAAAEGSGLESANVRSDDIASMQRGARIFFNYCAGCHSLEYMRYSRLAEDLKLDPKEVEKNFAFTGAKLGDHAISRMPAEDAAKWFGKAPPDLSLEARAKGVDWIYSYLKSFYLDPSRPLGWNNKVFENASMPNALWELQGLQVAETGTAPAGQGDASGALELKTPGRQTPEQFDTTVRDVTAFLQYVSEPAALQRRSIGVWVLLYLAFFTILAYLLKREYWKDVH